MSWSIDCVPDIMLDHKKVQKKTFGVISSFEIAGKKLETAYEPFNPAEGKQGKTPAILQFFGWDGGENNPISIVALVPKDVAKTLDGLLLNKGELKTAKVELAFKIWSWNNEENYWESRHTDGKTVKGVIPQQNGDLAIALDSNKSDAYSVGNRELYDFRFAVAPVGEHHVHAGNFPKQVTVHTWGIKGSDK